LSEGAPFLVKQDEDGKIWLSTIVTSKFEIKADTFVVFKFESDVHSLYERKQPAPNPYSRIANRKNKNQESKPALEKIRADSVVEKSLEKCHQCGAKVNNLAKHIERAHTNKKLFKCMQCGVEVRDLEKHYAKTHSVEAKIKSEYEKIRREKRKVELKIKKSLAKEVELLAKKGVCPICDYKSNSETAMIAHIRAVHNKNPTDLIKSSPAMVVKKVTAMEVAFGHASQKSMKLKQ
jgi:DNA-directed RNA polymerase subunit RPC12/RpoP